MKKAMDYKILRGRNHVLLEKAVMEHIKRGFEPTGGVFVLTDLDDGEQTWLQAIVEFDETK
jgi:hypothetical protein